MQMWWVLIPLSVRLCFAYDRSQCEKLAEQKATRMNHKDGSFVKLGWHEPVRVLEGRKAKLLCNHFGYRDGDPTFAPQVELRWYFNDKELSASKRIRISGCKKRPFINGTELTIYKVSEKDQGNYSCKLWIKGKDDNPSAVEIIDLALARPHEDFRLPSTRASFNESQGQDEPKMKWLSMFLPVPILGTIIIIACCCVFKYDEAKKGGSACLRYIYEKVLLRRKETSSSNDLAVHYCAADSSENKNLVEGVDAVKEIDIESICKKYSRIFPFLTENDIKDISNVEIQRERMQCNLQHSMPIVLGTGNFGQVYAGTVLNPKGSITPVAVKKLNDGYSTDELGNFLREVVTLMRAGNHINIISLVATIVLDTLDETSTSDAGIKVQRPPILVMELATGGNLRKYLQDNRENFVYNAAVESNWSLKDYDNPNKLDLQSLVSFGYQVARGMEHLSSRKILHRDLAARNVLLTDQLVVKIADFGLSKSMTDEKLYYRVNHQGITPAKWTAPESLWTSKFTVKSDVWSYGVLLWEILTMGGQPYATVPACKLYEYLAGGNRLKRPSLSTFELHEIMLTCWSWDPNLRPDFNVLVQKMSDISISLSKQPYPSFSNSRLRLTGCSNERDSGMSCGNSSVTESSYDSRSETAYSTVSYGSYMSTDTVIPLEESGPRDRASTIAYEIMNPLYENHSSETAETGSVVYVNDVTGHV